MKRRLSYTVFFVLMLVSLIFILPIISSAEENTENAVPHVSIDKFNLVFEDNVYLKYAVKFSGIDDEKITESNTGMLYFTEPKDDYTSGGEEHTSYVVGFTTICGEKYYTFEYRNLTAKQMTDYIYSVAYVDVDGQRYYSDPVKYSVLDYAYSKLGKTGEASENEDFIAMLESMLTYGANTQRYFDYNENRLADEEYYLVEVINGTLDDGFSKGLFHSTETATLQAPEKNGDLFFAAWLNSEGETISVKNPLEINGFSKNESYTAFYQETVDYSEGLQYTLSDDGTYYILTDLGSCTDNNVVIPRFFNDLPIKAIGSYAFHSTTSVSSVTMFDTIVSIKENAFYYCEGLQRISIPNSVTFIGKNAFYECNDVEITFEPLDDLIKSIAATEDALSSITFEENVSIPEEYYTLAINTLNTYYAFEGILERVISCEGLSTTVKAVAVNLLSLYKSEIAKYSDVFSTDGFGFSLVTFDYQKTLSAFTSLKNNRVLIESYVPTLTKLRDNFPDVIVYQGTTIKEFITVLSSSDFEFVIKLFDHLFGIYDDLSVVPESWTVQELELYSNGIEEAVAKIKGFSSSWSHDYSIVSHWRNDFSDIIYSYYVYVYEYNDPSLDKPAYIADLVGRIPLPSGPINRWYETYKQAFEYAYNGLNYTFADTTVFVYYYFESVKAIEACKKTDDALQRDIESILHQSIENLMFSLKQKYLSLFGAAVESKQITSLWENYLTVIAFLERGELTSIENASEEIKAMISDFVKLSPSELHVFLSSLHVNYRAVSGNLLALSYTGSFNSYFMMVLCEYYRSVMGNDGLSVVLQLLNSMEIYSLYIDSYSGEFRDSMERLIDMYEHLNDDTQAIFNDHFGPAYQLYYDIYYAMQYGHNESNKDSELEGLADVIDQFHTVWNALAQSDDSTLTYSFYGLLLSLSERAKNIYDDVAKNGDRNALISLYSKFYYIEQTDDYVTLEKAFFGTRSLFSSLMQLDFSILTSDVIYKKVTFGDLYTGSDLQTLFFDYAYFLYSGFDSDFKDTTDISALISKICSLEPVLHNLFKMFAGEFYYDALYNRFSELLSPDAMTVAEYLIDADKAYANYWSTGDDAYLQTFAKLMAEINEMYSYSVNANDSKYLNDFYNYFLNVYNTLS